MFTKIHSFGIQGLDAYPVTIEIDISTGLPITHIVGLPDNAIKESKERVKAAIKNSGYKFPIRRITINLSPADIKKEGPAFDLAIALGILADSNEINTNFLSQYAFLGELSLDGHIQPIKGALPITLEASKNPLKGIILPLANAKEASICDRINIYPVTTLSEVIYLLSNPESMQPFKSNFNDLISTNNYSIDFSDVKGQSHVKRGLEIAAAGGHNALLIGPPGSGKSMLAKRFPTILPDMTKKEILEITKIYSVMGLLKPDQSIMNTRPFRSPHHTTSDVAIVGGGSNPKPGEVTLSHHGVLFLDEFPEFNRDVLESLRQPMEDHQVTISRATKSIQFPANFILIAAMNHCPCGRLTVPHKACRCSSTQIQKYMSKISGPLLERIDIHLEVPALVSQELLQYSQSENSKTIQQKTSLARDVQHKRFNQPTHTNARMNHQEIKQFCHLSIDCKQLLRKAIEELGLSARSYDKILRVSRTIADLAKEECILPDHLCEAIQYRNLDRTW